ncbi:MAG: RNA polymerase subunit sigma-70 [Mycobacteriaceae bacterium]|nr:RNA polymerase subunit sigma-70 [Mycobacteriaceae bacterium]
MVDPGHMFRRAFSWLPSQLASQSEAPVGPRQFGSTEHLSTEAIAAFVDNELRLTPHLRAASHLSLCPQCAAEVDAQRQARSALRESHPIAIPSSLLGQLSQIPLCSGNAGDPSAATQDSQLAEGARQGRRKRR